MTSHSRPLGIDLEHLRTPIDPSETDPANIAIDVAEKMLAQAIDTAQHALGFPGDSNEVLTLATAELDSATRIYQTNQLVAALHALAPERAELAQPIAAPRLGQAFEKIGCCLRWPGFALALIAGVLAHVKGLL